MAVRRSPPPPRRILRLRRLVEGIGRLGDLAGAGAGLRLGEGAGSHGSVLRCRAVARMSTSRPV
ncbi:hypothetical protein CKO31_18195 [Thiohalocapsa halophila]|uniref:Uncharacterized protein n=1 Tax=Thiohalocapsa halophila TaxID=69359 RepID=A0ABS1CLB9_9GAMM|nr:hypothetical protein [Thiohalocapsa halophila]